MSTPKPYDAALVDDLAQRTADSLDWDWPTAEIEHDGSATVYPSGPDTIRPEVELILDRLVELGWRPPEPLSATVNGVVINVTGSLDKAEALEILRRSIRGRGVK